MPRVTAQRGQSLYLLCWEHSTPARLLLAHRENASLRSLLEQRARSANTGTGLLDIGVHLRAGDEVFVDDSWLPRAPGSARMTVGPIGRSPRSYLEQAHEVAFGGSVASVRWEPSDGYAANRGRMLQIYEYYTATYNRNPARFLWAGLGKLAGAAVISGLDTLVDVMGDGPNLSHKLVRIAKEIFYDVAWLHEAAADDPDHALVLAQLHDARRHRVRSDGSSVPTRYVRAMQSGVTVRAAGYRAGFGSYARAIHHITRGDEEDRKYGNLALLANEQWVNIQPWYDSINSVSRWLFERGSPMVRSVHPYHRDFIIDVHGYVDRAPDRWSWINDVPNAMWPRWVGISQSERSRLVNLSLSELMARRWGPVQPSQTPPGTQY